MKVRLKTSTPRARVESPLGLVPCDWPIMRLADVALKIKAGATPTGGGQAYQATRTRYALIRSQNVYDRRFTHEGLAFISDEQASELAGSEVQARDLLLNITGDGTTFARAAMAPADALPACVNQHVMIIRPDSERCDPGYLLAYLTHPLIKAYIESFNAGGSRRAITKGHISSFEIPLPPITEQRAIARVLGDLDDKIELNRRMNATMEAMAQALFRSWFVDFDPVRAKAEGRAPEGMDAATAAFFPDTLIESEFGEIPEGWRLAPLPEAIEVNPFRPLSKGAIAPYLDMANMPTASARANEVIDREFGSGMRFVDGDTLVARITPCLENGKTCYVDFLGDGVVGWGSTEYIVLRPREPLPLAYAYFLARTDFFRDFAKANMTGTSGRQRVPADCFGKFPVVVPTPDVARCFGERVTSILQTMKAHDEEARSLAALRDELLPRLLSGELRVPELEEVAT